MVTGSIRYFRLPALVLLLSIWLPCQAKPLGLEGQWYEAPSKWSYAGQAALEGAGPMRISQLNKTGGHYFYQADFDAGQETLVLDFKNSSVVGRFHHRVFDQQGRQVADAEGGIQSEAANPFFLRHGREIKLPPGRYRLITEVSSPFFLAQPRPYLDTLEHYRQAIKPGNALTLLCLGVLLGLAFYYAVLAIIRSNAPNTLYVLFILGNLLYNGTALLVYGELFGLHWFYLISLPILISNCAYIIFVFRLLDITRESHPRLHRIGMVLLGLFAVFIAIAAFAPNWSLELDRIGVGLFISYGLGAGIVRARQGHPIARMYLAAVAIFFMLGAVSISLSEVEGVYAFYVEHLGLLSVTVEALLLAFVLSYQFAQLSREKESALSLSQELRTLIENSPDTIARYDSSCRRIYANSAFGALSKGGVAALLGKRPTEVPGGPDSEMYEQKILGVFATGINTTFEIKWFDKDGTERTTHVRLTAERGPAGGITSVLGVGRDISELNEYRNELRAKELAKTRFLAAAGHDLRQPLSAANLFIDALKLTEPTSRQDEIIHRLDQAMSTFNGLLDSLLNISKLDAGAIKPESMSISLPEVFTWLEQNFEPLASEKGIGFKLYFPLRDVLAVQSDFGLLKSILMNLVSNAIKYTAQGAILVSARRRGTEVLFQVWDTGIGISEENITRIFDEFYQVDNPQRDRTKGLGLGLSIVKRALLLLDSEITCRSQVGRGTVFEFRLPLAGFPGIHQLVASAASREEMPVGAIPQGGRFIVVEDDVLVAQAMRNLLEGLGCEVTCFHTAEDALLYPHIEQADYFISDYMLGGAHNGLQFLNLLRQKLARPINAVLVTGDTSPSFYAELTNCPWAVLHKPVSLSVLFSSLRAH